MVVAAAGEDRGGGGDPTLRSRAARLICSTAHRVGAGRTPLNAPPREERLRRGRRQTSDATHNHHRCRRLDVAKSSECLRGRRRTTSRKRASLVGLRQHVDALNLARLVNVYLVWFSIENPFIWTSALGNFLHLPSILTDTAALTWWLMGGREMNGDGLEPMGCRHAREQRISARRVERASLDVLVDDGLLVRIHVWPGADPPEPVRPKQASTTYISAGMRCPHSPLPPNRHNGRGPAEPLCSVSCMGGRAKERSGRTHRQVAHRRHVLWERRWRRRRPPTRARLQGARETEEPQAERKRRNKNDKKNRLPVSSSGARSRSPCRPASRTAHGGGHAPRGARRRWGVGGATAARRPSQMRL